MGSYRVVLAKSVRKKDLVRVPAKDLARIIARIKALALDPYPPDSAQLVGRFERRIRQGDYRILYLVEEEIVTVQVVRVGHRRDVYKA
jgi:mRNA interferase RelE/StbE